VFLILDRLKVHRARLTRDWLAEHRAEIEVHYLPPYSPEPSGHCPIGANFRRGAVDRPVISGGDAARILLVRSAMA
jgi:DDE superfamily endonuclease